MFSIFKKKEAPSLWTHNVHEDHYPSANNLTAAGKKYQAEMMNSNPMKNFMFDRYFGIDETNPKYKGMNFFVIGDDKRDVADRVFRYQIEQFKTSFVISTSSLVLLGMVRGELAKHGYQIRTLNFSTNNEIGNLSNQVEQAMVYNIFEQVKGRAEVDELVRTMIKMTPFDTQKNAFMNDIVRALLMSAILFKQINNDTSYQSLYKFVESAELKTKAEKSAQKNDFDKMFEEARLFANVGSEENKKRAKDAYDFYKVFHSSCGQSRTFIVRTALDVLKVYSGDNSGPRAKKFDLNEFANRKFALFIVVDDKDKNLISHGRVVTQAIINQFEKEQPRSNVRFMVEGVEKYLRTADFTSLINNQGKYSFTTVLHSMDELNTIEKENMKRLNDLSDVLIYMGSQKKDDKKHEYVMDMLKEIQAAAPGFTQACKLAKKDMANNACVYSPDNKLTFEMSANEQIVFIKEQLPFLLTYIY